MGARFRTCVAERSASAGGAATARSVGGSGFSGRFFMSCGLCARRSLARARSSGFEAALVLSRERARWWILSVARRAADAGERNIDLDAGWPRISCARTSVRSKWIVLP
ncbi:unnamed protein product, partial [Pelagomonas calceolata]